MRLTTVAPPVGRESYSAVLGVHFEECRCLTVFDLEQVFNQNVRYLEEILTYRFVVSAVCYLIVRPLVNLTTCMSVKKPVLVILVKDAKSLLKMWTIKMKCSNYNSTKNSPYIQCDQMTRLCFQYLAIFSNEICSKAYKLCQCELKTLPKTK